MSEPLRRDAVACFEAAVAAVEPERLVRAFLAEHPDFVEIPGKVYVVSFGKAAAAMARGAVAVAAPEGGVVVVPRGGGVGIPEGLDVYEGGHPVPSYEGVEGAQAVQALAEAAGAGDLLLVLISGGGSALLSLPPAEISLADLQVTTDLMLRAGAEITELNTVRKHLDQLKGGQLAQAASPTRVLALVISDVVGDPLDVIASGPVSPDPTTFRDATEILERLGLWGELPDSVRQHLSAGSEGVVTETPDASAGCFDGVEISIVGNNAMAAAAAQAEAQSRGYLSVVTSTTVTGEAREVGARLAATAASIALGEEPIAPPACVVSAGETTVTVTGEGVGGRNQEVALAAAVELGKLPDEVRGHVLVASVGTDGIDGPTDAAGAVATGATTARARALGRDPQAALDANDSYPFFDALGDLIVTGPTGTNVMDIQLVMVGLQP